MNLSVRAGLSVLCASWMSSLFAAWGNANFGGSKDALGRYYFHDPANWSGVDPKYTTNATDPGLGLNAGTQWFTLADDFTSTRLVIQQTGSKHGIDLAGHTLTMKGSIRHYTYANSFTVTNGTLAIPNGPYQVSRLQGTDSNPYDCALAVFGPTTTLDVNSLELSLGSQNKAEIGGGATVKATLNFGTVKGPTADAPFKGNQILVKDAGTVFENKTSAINVFTCGNCRDNLLEVSGGALFKGLDKLWVYGQGNIMRFADGALTTTPSCLSIVEGSSNVIEVAGCTLPTTLSRLNITAGQDHRITLSDGAKMFFCDEYGPFNGEVNGCMFEVVSGAVFARTNSVASATKKTYVANNAGAHDNVIRVAGAGSKFICDAYFHIGDLDSHETVLVEDGGALDAAGAVYVGQSRTAGNALVAKGVDSKVLAQQVFLGANGASFCRVAVSDNAVVTNRANACVGWWKREPSDAQFSSNPGGTNTLCITSGAKFSAQWLSTSGVGNLIALTNGTLELTGMGQLLTDKWYSLAVPDPIFETEAALAKLQTVPRDTRILIGGTNSVIKGSNMRFAKGTEFSFEIPAEGYSQVPLQSSNIIELIECGKVSIDADAYRAAHPKDGIVLMEASNRIDIDQSSMAAFVAAAGDHYKVMLVDRKKLVLKPRLGLVVVVQ